MKKKIKVLHVVSSYDPSEGGPPISINNIAYSLRNSKSIENSLLTSISKESKIKYFKQTYLEKLFLKKFYVPNFSMILKIKNAVKKNQIIHLHNFWNFTIFISLFFSIIYKKKIILSPHGSFDIYNMRKSFLKKYIYLFFFGNYQINKIHSFHFLTNKEKQNSFYKKNKKKLILSNFSKKISNISKLKIDRNKINFCYLGRLDRIKNLDYQIKLISELNKKIDVKLTIIGPDYGVKQQLINLVDNLNLRNIVEFKSPIYNNNKYSWLKYSDFVLLTSHYECNSILALETLACGGCLITNQKTNLSYLKKYKVVQFVEENVFKSSKKMIRIIQNKKFNIIQRKNSLNFTKKYNEIYFQNKITKFYSKII